MLCDGLVLIVARNNLTFLFSLRKRWTTTRKFFPTLVVVVWFYLFSLFFASSKRNRKSNKQIEEKQVGEELFGRLSAGLCPSLVPL